MTIPSPKPRLQRVAATEEGHECGLQLLYCWCWLVAELVRHSVFVSQLANFCSVASQSFLTAVVMAGLGVVLSKRKQSSNNDTDRCPIFCDSEILATVQMKNVFNSSKTFVDM